MRPTLLAFGLAISLVGVVSGQEVIPRASSTVIKEFSKVAVTEELVTPTKVADRSNTFVIEIKVLEGKDLIGEGPTSRSLGRPNGATVKRVNADNLRSRMAPPARVRAILPNTVASPEGDVRRREAPTMHEDDDLWNDALRSPSVTVLAAPRLAVVGARSATFQIQSEQSFVYLEPLGNGKFQAKHTAPHELGMKFTLAVQPVAGDDRSIDISPLEIQLSVLDGREPVEGLDLDVGKPIIATRSLKTTATMKLGATRLIAIPSGPKTQAALLLRINRRDFPEQE